MTMLPAARQNVFLSTLSLRRATARGGRGPCEHLHFYPRSPCGERPAPQPVGQYDGLISIHALLAESDLFLVFWCIFSLYISIHALLAESDRKVFSIFLPIRISIHALLAESDRAPPYNLMIHHDFYPRSPCGERQATKSDQGASNQFLSTLSLRRATHTCQYFFSNI
mgnify:CR=1 FL=1